MPNVEIIKVKGHASNFCNQIADKLAGVFGGGGHKKEAGFTVENMSVETIVEKTKEYLKSINKL